MNLNVTDEQFIQGVRANPEQRMEQTAEGIDRRIADHTSNDMR